MRVARITQNMRDARWLRGKSEINEMDVGQHDKYTSEHSACDGDLCARECEVAALDFHFRASALLLTCLRRGPEIENKEQKRLALDGIQALIPRRHMALAAAIDGCRQRSRVTAIQE